MNDLLILRKRSWRLLLIGGMVTVLMFSLWGMMAKANAGQLLDVGYLDFSYGTTVRGEPTAEKPESKLWWNDGYWWGILYNDTVAEYRIYRLNWGTQQWEDTGVSVDNRTAARADVLWDAPNNKLYVASHIATAEANHTSNPNERAWMYRYSYDAATEKYTLDGGPADIINDKTEALVLDKDSTDRFWVTYVSRDVSPDKYEVWVNTSTSSGLSWGTPFTLTLPGDISNTQRVSSDDISALIAFDSKIGVMWSNQYTGHDRFYFATHTDSAAPSAGWTLEYTSPVSIVSNDHINLATSASGQVFAAVKTSNPLSTDPGILLIARDTDGSFSEHEFSDVSSKDTRPIVVVNEDENKVYLFVDSNAAGGRVCYKAATITTPLSSMSFASGNCKDSDPPGAPLFLADSNYDKINNATSTKQRVNDTTGLVVLASDDVLNQVYVHNVMGDPPPVVTLRTPGIDATGVAVTSVVRVTFSKDMNPSTINTSSFGVLEGVTPVPGSVDYDSSTRTAVFTPTSSLKANATFTVRLSDAIKDSSNQSLYGSTAIREEWSFTTTAPTVQFSMADYTVNEDVGTATITVTLNTQSTGAVTVDYAASAGTATSPDDFTAIPATQMTIPAGDTSGTFNVTIVDDVLEEPNETVNLTLSNPGGATLGAPSASTLHIIDNEGIPTVQFANGTYSVNEADGTAAIEVTLSHASTINTITVNYASADGTAVAGSDYTAVSDVLTFNIGETSKTFNVPILNDSLAEPDQTVNLTLSSPSNADLGAPSTAVLTITDDEPTPTVSISNDPYNVNEDAGAFAVTVVLSAQSEQTVTVDYATVDGTAVAGADYTAASGQVTFNPTETSKTFNVTINEDALDEAVEDFQVALSSPVNADLGTPATATVNIADNDDPPTVYFDSSSFTAAEDDGKSTITVRLSAPSGKSVAVDYTTTDGTATAGLDYKGITGETLVFAPGQTSKTFDVSLFPDTIIEPQETVNLSLSNPEDATLGSPIAATLYINDSDGVLIYLPVILRN